MILASEHLQLMAGISHEIRNPVYAILGLAYLLRNETDPKDRQELTLAIFQSAEDLRELTSNVLDYTKGWAGSSQSYPLDLRKEIPLILFVQETMGQV